MAGQRAEKGAKKRGRLIALILAAALFVFLLTDWYLSNHVLYREDITVSSPNLPEALDGYKIAHLSDLHQNSWGKNNEKLLSMLREAKPNMIAITGDYIDAPKDVPWALSLAEELVKIAPVYYVTGNHEWAKGAAKELVIKGDLRKLGVSVVENSYYSFGENKEWCIAGIGDPNGPYDQPLASEVISGLREKLGDPYIILLSHRYDRFDEYVELGVDLALSGHAHGGGVRLPFTDGLIGPGMRFFPKRTNGLYTSGDTAMVVSRGMDGSGFRLFNRCHVLMITLTR